MKRKKRRSKADIITGVLYVIFGMLVLSALYGLGSLVYTLLGAEVGNSYYAGLAEDMHTQDAVNFTALAAKNPEIKAWVTLNDTAINFPVVQTSDNTFYLTHRFDEKRNKLGTPFIDAGNTGTFSDRHTVIYGHAVRSGAMLGSLWEYENPNYYQRHPEIQLVLADGRQLTLAVFACARVPGVRSSIPISFSGDDDFLAMVENLRTLSAFSSAVKVESTDRLVSFCVVTPDGGDERLLVSCKIIESAGVTALSDETAGPATTDIAPTEIPAG
ncbi:MAG: class B sortase [Eubacteriales bacterium]|nr:class B sortase [Eubacteriales bacterium]